MEFDDHYESNFMKELIKFFSILKEQAVNLLTYKEEIK